MLIFDEAGHLTDTTGGPASDERLFTALTGSTVVFGEQARVLLVSTPHGKGNLFHRLYEGAVSGTLDSARATHRTIHEMNPDISQAWLDARRAELGEAMFEQEFLAAFTDAAGSFFDLRDVPLDDVPAPPDAARSWIAGLDIAFHQDTCAAVLVGESAAEPGVLLVGSVVGIVPGGKRKSLAARRRREDQTLAEVLAAITPYSPSRIIADGYLATVARDYFGRAGIPVVIAPTTGASQTSAFVSVRARLADGSLRLWDEPHLIAELRAVRVRETSDSVYLPRVGDSHCDRAVALAAAVSHLRHANGYVEGRPSAGPSHLSEASRRLGGAPDAARFGHRRGPLSIRDMDF